MTGDDNSRTVVLIATIAAFIIVGVLVRLISRKLRGESTEPVARWDFTFTKKSTAIFVAAFILAIAMMTLTDSKSIGLGLLAAVAIYLVKDQSDSNAKTREQNQDHDKQ